MAIELGLQLPSSRLKTAEVIARRAASKPWKRPIGESTREPKIAMLRRKANLPSNWLAIPRVQAYRLSDGRLAIRTNHARTNPANDRKIVVRVLLRGPHLFYLFLHFDDVDAMVPLPSLGKAGIGAFTHDGSGN